MSEFTSNNGLRLEALADFSRGMVRGENGKMLIEKHNEVIASVTPMETMVLLDLLLQEGFSNDLVKASLGKLINTFYSSLSACEWEKPDENHFLSCLMRENRAVEKIMKDIKSVLKLLPKTENSLDEPVKADLLKLVNELKVYELHYIKKENILFPIIEKTFPQYRCLQLMWSFHDDFRKIIKNIGAILSEAVPDKVILIRELGKLFFVVLPVIFREEQIVFPVAYRAIPARSWDEMMQQSFEIGWCYIAPPSKLQVVIPEGDMLNGKVNLGTGSLTPGQISLLFDSLPVDITFVDENDEVCYFSGGKERIFPRSKAIIGRKVQNCHPHESVHIVNEIVDAFRSGTRDSADFWIQMKGRFIQIRYFAIRNEQGEYKGTIEVSQDVTGIRSLQGERRLLDWNP